MSSLVAYEDSDSDDDLTQAALPKSASVDSQLPCASHFAKMDVKAVSHGDAFCSASALQPRGTEIPHRDLPPDWPQEISSTPWAAPVGLKSSTQGLQSSALLSRGLGDAIARKRPQVAVGAVKPYVPKRQRMGQMPEHDTETALQTEIPAAGATDSKLLTEVSDSVRPYLGRKTGRTELPRHARLHIQAHQGPVNTVQWCPVPQFSHLLLSASMDKTVKVWDGAGSGRLLRRCSSHTEAVRDACWAPGGRHVLSGSFDSTAQLTDVETGQQVANLRSQFKVTCLSFHPRDPNVFLCGGFSPEVKAWDVRSCKVVRGYQAGVQQTLDIQFLAGGQDFVTSTDSVSRDSADRTLIAWDFQTTAKVSNQIYHERYTCPSLALHPQEDFFVAQTNGNYIALFSAQRPYRMNKRKRYEGHKVEGYAVGCEFSSDGLFLVTGSSSGTVHFYNYQSSRLIKTLSAHKQACVCVTFHPVMPAVAATCDWSGEINIWH
ncbi:WD repeat-containing protein 25 [Lepisosteus oculatus]|uniref:WD repeat-containing protein 25 n=1 Tax=Lepisosteus oculatus TaxID=7918 RepID=UPI00371EB8A6